MTTTRRTFLRAATIGFGFAAGSAHAAPDGRVRRIGIVPVQGWGTQDMPEVWAAFDAELRDRGWVEGRNLVIERKEAPLDRTQLPALMVELIALGVEVICVYNAWSALAAKEATDRIPIVFIVGDAAGRGIVANLARPERNLTGTSGQFVELQAKTVELLKLVAPGVRRVGVLYNLGLGIPPAMLQDAYKPRGVDVFVLDVRNLDELGRALIQFSERKVDAIVVAQYWPPAIAAELVAAVTRRRLPTIFVDRGYVEMGGLISFGVDYLANVRIQAAYVDKLLRGAKPADLPVQQPLAFDIAVNLKTARDLGITIPDEVLVRADLVIE